MDRTCGGSSVSRRGSGFLTLLERRERGIKTLDATHLCRHANGARNGIDAVTPIGQRYSVFCGYVRNDVFEMLDVFFELVMIHSFPRNTR